MESGFARGGRDGAARGVRFGDYELRERAASGGMGVIYQAWHTGLRRLVALKMLKSGRLADAAERQRFSTEAEAVADRSPDAIRRSDREAALPLAQ